MPAPVRTVCRPARRVWPRVAHRLPPLLDAVDERGQPRPSGPPVRGHVRGRAPCDVARLSQRILYAEISIDPRPVSQPAAGPGLRSGPFLGTFSGPRLASKNRNGSGSRRLADAPRRPSQTRGLREEAQRVPRAPRHPRPPAPVASCQPRQPRTGTTHPAATGRPLDRSRGRLPAPARPRDEPALTRPRDARRDAQRCRRRRAPRPADAQVQGVHARAGRQRGRC